MSARNPSRAVALIDVQHREVRNGWSATETLPASVLMLKRVSLLILNDTYGPVR
jgi:hypothetical protein